MFIFGENSIEFYTLDTFWSLTMSLLKSIGFRNAPFQTYWNTGTSFDIHTGVFVPGTHGGMVLNGGLSSSNGYLGRPQMFKSTEMLSHFVRAMSIYPRSELAILDTEYSLKEDRIAGFSPYGNKEEIVSRMEITTPDVTTPEEFFSQMKELGEQKLKHKDDYLVESPIIDPNTGKPQLILLPSFVQLLNKSEK